MFTWLHAHLKWAFYFVIILVHVSRCYNSLEILSRRCFVSIEIRVTYFGCKSQTTLFQIRILLNPIRVTVHKRSRYVSCGVFPDRTDQKIQLIGKTFNH